MTRKTICTTQHLAGTGPGGETASGSAAYRIVEDHGHLPDTDNFLIWNIAKLRRSRQKVTFS